MGRMRSPDYQLMQRKMGFTQQSISYDGSGEDAVDPFLAADLALTKRIAEVLEAHYPSQPWMVKVQHSQGVVHVALPIVMPTGTVFNLKISDLKSDPSLNRVKRAGGEILERYNVPRGGFRLDPFLEARSNNPAAQSGPKFILE